MYFIFYFTDQLKDRISNDFLAFKGFRKIRSSACENEFLSDFSWHLTKRSYRNIMRTRIYLNTRTIQFINARGFQFSIHINNYNKPTDYQNFSPDFPIRTLENTCPDKKTLRNRLCCFVQIMSSLGLKGFSICVRTIEQGHDISGT